MSDEPASAASQWPWRLGKLSVRKTFLPITLLSSSKDMDYGATDTLLKVVQRCTAALLKMGTLRYTQL
jgi:hypothetical protein